MMHANGIGSNSVVTDRNSMHSSLISLGYSERPTENHVMSGFPWPLAPGESMVNFSVGQMTSGVGTIANPGEFWNSESERDTARDFNSYPQILGAQEPIQLMEGMPLPVSLPSSRQCIDAVDDQSKFMAPVPFVYPLEYTKNAALGSSILNSSFENLNCIEGLPFDTSSRWGFNKMINPPEIMGRNGVQSVLQPGGSSSPTRWIVNEEMGGVNSANPGMSRFSNELSLGLATSQTRNICGAAVQEQCKDMSSSGVTGFSSDKRQSEPESCSNSNLSLSFNSYKPLQFPPLLSGSKFFQAVQEILAEIACYALENFNQMSYLSSGMDNGANHSFSSGGRGCSDINFGNAIDGDQRLMARNNAMLERDVGAKKKHLLALLQVVDDRYNQCVDEIHTVISAFHAVTELDPTLHARFALPAISFMYKNLRERISSHILAMGTQQPMEDDARGDDQSFETSFIRKQWALQQIRKRDHQLWRPQRGLPERSVSVLRAWMFQNFLHPYPKDAEKHLLALRSGLTRSQVSNWFINARVRLWKPMIEEMYAEVNKRKARRHEEETGHKNHMRFEDRRFTMNRI